MFLVWVNQNPSNLICIKVYVVFLKTTQKLSHGVWAWAKQTLHGLLAGELDTQRENLGLCGTAGLDSLVHCTANLEALPV